MDVDTTGFDIDIVDGKILLTISLVKEGLLYSFQCVLPMGRAAELASEIKVMVETAERKGHGR